MSVFCCTGGTLYDGPIEETSVTRKYLALEVLKLGDTFKQAAKACHNHGSIQNPLTAVEAEKQSNI